MKKRTTNSTAQQPTLADLALQSIARAKRRKPRTTPEDVLQDMADDYMEQIRTIGPLRTPDQARALKEICNKHGIIPVGDLTDMIGHRPLGYIYDLFERNGGTSMASSEGPAIDFSARKRALAAGRAQA